MCHLTHFTFRHKNNKYRTYNVAVSYKRKFSELVKYGKQLESGDIATGLFFKEIEVTKWKLNVWRE